MAGAVAAWSASGCGQRLVGGGSQRPPNFVFIFADDQGYQDLGCFGSPDIATPRIDAMAAAGVRCTNFLAAAPVCTPSRAALMTGCYAQRVSLPRVLFPQDNVGLSSYEVTLAELLKARGYSTACIGKWHLGHHAPFLPTRHGFDSYFGLPYSNDMRPENKARNYPPLPLMRDEKVIEENPDQSLLTERYTAEAIAFIEKNQQRPFYLYLPHTMVHVPLFVSQRFAGESKRGLYGDAVAGIDWSTGQILDTLKRLGLEQNTLVFYTSDNGPWLAQGKNGGSALPLREGKGTIYEGGMREPCIAYWPGRVPAGRTCDEFFSTLDILPTFAALAGTAAPTDRIIDGCDVGPLLLGQSGATRARPDFYYYNGYALRAVRLGDWKLVLPGTRVTLGTRTPIPEALYNLREDVSEKNNLVEKHPDMAAKLRALAETARADLGDSQQRNPGKNRRQCGRVGA